MDTWKKKSILFFLSQGVSLFGLFSAIFSCCLPIGMIVFGPLADVISMRILMIISGVLLIVLALIVTCDRKFYRAGAKPINEPESDMENQQ